MALLFRQSCKRTPPSPFPLRAPQAQMRQLQEALEHKEAEVTELHRLLSAMEGDVAQSEEEKAELKQQYEKRIALANTKVKRRGMGKRAAQGFLKTKIKRQSRLIRALNLSPLTSPLSPHNPFPLSLTFSF